MFKKPPKGDRNFLKNQEERLHHEVAPPYDLASMVVIRYSLSCPAIHYGGVCTL